MSKFVKIIKCKGYNCCTWYRNKIGQVFEVIDEGTLTAEDLITHEKQELYLTFDRHQICRDDCKEVQFSEIDKLMYQMGYKEQL